MSGRKDWKEVLDDYRDRREDLYADRTPLARRDEVAATCRPPFRKTKTRNTMSGGASESINPLVATDRESQDPCRFFERDDQRSRYGAEWKNDDHSRDFSTMNGSHPRGPIHNHDPRDAVSGRAVSWLNGHLLEVRARCTPGIKAIHF